MGFNDSSNISVVGNSLKSRLVFFSLDLDECASDPKSCPHGETCINGDGSFFCLNTTNDKGILLDSFGAAYNRLNTRFHT